MNCFCFLVLAALALVLTPVASRTGDLTVFAAASLRTALDEVNEAWRQAAGSPAIGVFAASNALATQIAEGAPADVFISADEAWMDDLAAKGLLRPGSRIALLGNALVLVAPAGEASPVDLTPPVDLESRLGDGRLAVGDTASVPAGRYAKAALEALGAWAGVKDHLAEQANVRAALALVARGEAPLGIVYLTDARAEPAVAVVATFPAASHPAIVYPAAITASSTNPAAERYLAFLRGSVAQEIFRRHGFAILD
ncbi:MAG: molybdate ABC transporter substrate-binding protein [Alphaproteobacteria bacterium]|nr:molybdate ABC transporter substrate-binding protein [Alphaproteobacteria bacterium]